MVQKKTSHAPVKITDTTFRDGHPDLFRTEDPIAGSVGHLPAKPALFEIRRTYVPHHVRAVPEHPAWGLPLPETHLHIRLPARHPENPSRAQAHFGQPMINHSTAPPGQDRRNTHRPSAHIPGRILAITMPPPGTRRQGCPARHNTCGAAILKHT